MRNALLADFAEALSVDSGEVATLHDARLPLPEPQSRIDVVVVADPAEFWECFEREASRADGTLLVAPELQGTLTTLAERAERRGAKLLSPSADFVAWTADKHRTAATLQRLGLPTPAGHHVIDALSRKISEDCEPWPKVVKPFDGAGSLGVRLVHDHAHLVRSHSQGLVRDNDRLETFRPGVPGSIAMLAGSAGVWPMVPTIQHLSNDGGFRYFGGETVTDLGLIARARKLAQRFADAARPSRGWFGIDFVWGRFQDGEEDWIIEVNPRITTSYLGLRAIADCNLAQAMLTAADGKRPSLEFATRRVVFRPNGALEEYAPPARRELP